MFVQGARKKHMEVLHLRKNGAHLTALLQQQRQKR
jgi:hypothetical protein